MIANAPAGASISPVMHYLQTRGLLQHRNLPYCPRRLVYLPHSPSPSREMKRRSLPSFRSLACVGSIRSFLSSATVTTPPCGQRLFPARLPLAGILPSSPHIYWVCSPTSRPQITTWNIFVGLCPRTMAFDSPPCARPLGRSAIRASGFLTACRRDAERLSASSVTSLDEPPHTRAHRPLGAPVSGPFITPFPPCS